ncbi:unnamed protein product [Bursaphelenchus xylophilus]|uniref:(pine wood nematode) hypothetical protein n=1 Tax=Bursaphelenchus xylophilus TaxID=6326 RepID=A0A811KDL6_BURXY|nr:unnamed protein product [Bursaphelenchus xylophilus]CAG9092591.1 unnamed protein product [Bursaphelenchus xylophilus]
MIVLNTPEIVLFDADCPRSYGKCPVYCEVPQFCRSFCNPLCCGTVAACGKVKGYDHNSTMFKLRGKQFWHAPQTDAVGVWAEDEVHVLPVPQPGKDGDRMSLGVVDLVLQTPRVPFFDPKNPAKHPTIKNFVHLLLERGLINHTSVTIAFPVKSPIGRLQYYYTFGEMDTENCHDNMKLVSAVGEREWIFDAIAVNFFGYKSEGMFRMILTEGIAVQLPRNVLQQFIEAGVFTRYPVIYENVYYINQSLLVEDKISFQIDEQLRIDGDSKTMGIAVEGTAAIFSPIDPNPDNVQWIVGRMIYHQYCVTLDYERGTIGFSKVKDIHYIND